MRRRGSGHLRPAQVALVGPRHRRHGLPASAAPLAAAPRLLGRARLAYTAQARSSRIAHIFEFFAISDFFFSHGFVPVRPTKAEQACNSYR